MFFYEIGYSTWEECPTTSLVHNQEFTQDEFNDILSNAYIQVSKSSEIAHNTWCEDWVKSDENTGGDSDRDFYQYQLTLHKYKPRISDLYNGVIDYLITKHKFSELNFSARFIPSDNHGLVPDEFGHIEETDDETTIMLRRVFNVIEPRNNKIDEILGNE